MAKKVKVSREELVAFAREMNEVMGLDPAISLKKSVTDEELLENIMSEGVDNIYATDFEEDEEDDEKVIFSDEAKKTMKKLGIEVVAAETEEEPEEVEEEKPAKKGKAKKEEVEEEVPKKGKGKKVEPEEEPEEEKPVKKGKKKPEPEPEPEEDVEVTEDVINEMAYDDLLELVTEKELDIDTDDFPKKKVKALREAIIEALFSEEEALTADDVMGMEYKDLVELVTIKELDIDVDEFPKKKAVKLAEAIIEALELTEEEPEEEEKPVKKGKTKKEEVEEEAPKKKGTTEKGKALAESNAAKKERLAESKKEKKKDRKSREEVFMSLMKDKKPHSKEEMLKSQLEDYGGSDSWAVYTVNSYIRMLTFFGIIEEKKGKYVLC